MVQREPTPWGFITRLQHKGTFALLAANVLGAIAYLAAASPSWAIPDERASGIHSITGEPFVWALSVWPILTVFVLLNLGWAAVILAKSRWQDGRLWLTAPLIWLVAILVDFAHH
jgi:hypothetical protein